MRKKVGKVRSNYAIGYGRPPRWLQFQPGQSGNPKGRPKGARNAASLARDALEQTISVKDDKSRRKMTVRKAAYRRLAEKAAAGDVKALDYLLSLESHERPPGSDQSETQTSSAKDLELLQGFFDRRRARVSQKVQPHAQRRSRGKTEKETQ